ncbi:ATP-binding cassette domain-containing protein [[Mycoplasma] gypis]|uniref:ABC transporter ATP-binding protein n=1 Tax=[Mycoplasma] gypis TaxID=92404 RepID=A0ABZ2RNF5_9BACT|nr:ABC transporter ATP-binding protein [[Mycoplasma] gypis]MBN0919343.1 ABC transporter ATP-binding protein [[Mycoplasma] gypis]
MKCNFYKFLEENNIKYLRANVTSLSLKTQPNRVRIRSDAFLKSAVNEGTKDLFLVSSYKNINKDITHIILLSNWFLKYSHSLGSSNSFLNFNYEDLEMFSQYSGFQYKNFQTKNSPETNKFIFLTLNDKDFSEELFYNYKSSSEKIFDDLLLNFSESSQTKKSDPSIPLWVKEKLLRDFNFSCAIHSVNPNNCRTSMNWQKTRENLKGTNLNVPVDFHHFVPRSFFKKEFYNSDKSQILDWNKIHNLINVIPLCQICHQSIHNSDKELQKQTFNLIIDTYKTKNNIEKFNDSSVQNIIINASILAGLMLLDIVLLYANNILYMKIIYFSHLHIRNDIFKEISQKHPRSLKNISSAEITSILEKNGNMLAQFQIMYSVLFTLIPTLIGVIILYSFLSWQILLVFIGIALIQVFLGFVYNIFYSSVLSRQAKNNSRLLNKVQEILNVLTTFVYANKKELLITHFNKGLKEYYHLENKFKNYDSTYTFIKNVTSWLFLGIVLICSIVFYKNNFLTLAVVIFSIIHFVQIQSFVDQLIKISLSFGQVKHMAKQTNDFLNSLQNKELLTLDSFTNIKLQNINLKYDDSKQIFKDFNLEINAKDMILVRGESGKGKSTLLDIIMNINQEYEGQASINNIEYNSSLSLENQIEFVSKNTTINKLNDDIDKAIVEDDILDIEKLNLIKEEFLIDFDLKQDNISEGQMQRLKLANAFYKNKDIYILDEVISNIDQKHREQILKNILKQNKTLIMVSHHITNPQQYNFDKIITL